MDGVNWKKAYHDLEDHIELMMKETSELVNNATPQLRINEIRVNDEGPFLEVIIDASGDKMSYACYLIDRKGELEKIKLPYQSSNTFYFNVESGRYTVQGFVRQYENDLDIVSEKLGTNFKKVMLNEQDD